MTNESAIIEENDLLAEDLQDAAQTDPEADRYDIEEPDDDSEEFNVPVIDNLDDDDGKIPSSEDKTETKPKDSAKTEDDTGQEKETAEKQQQNELPDELVAKAKKLGISDTDIALFEKPAQLEKLCSLVEPTVTEAKDKQEKQTEQNSDASYNEGDFKLELDPDLYDSDLCNAMQSTASQINGIKGALSDIAGAIQRQSEESFEKNFEGMIAGLGDDFADTLGQGNLDEIGTDSDFYKNRCKLVEEMNAIASGYGQTGKAIPGPKQLFSRALNSIFADKIKTNTRKEIAAQIEKRSGQIISKPTGKKGKDSMTPEMRAATTVRQKLREFGAYDDNEIAEDF